MDHHHVGAHGDAARGFWIEHVRLGLWMSAVVISMIAVYLVATPGRTHQALAWGIVVAAAVTTVAVAALPWRRLVQGPLALRTMVVWSLLLVPMIVLLSAVDGGSSSPIGLLLMLPLVFASMAYPFRATLLVGAAMVVGQLAIAVVSGPVTPQDVVLRAAVLVLVAMMGALTSRNHWRTVNRVEELAGQLQRLAHVDGLTGCLNHRGFHERLDAEVARSRRTAHPLALLQVDLDHFKLVNDGFGHPVGDEVLMAVGGVLRQVARRADAVGRVGGEEFAVLLPGSDLAEATAVAERLRDAVGTMALPVPVTLSVGVSALPEAAATDEELVTTADRALYAAKRAGRDRVVVAGRRDELVVSP